MLTRKTYCLAPLILLFFCSQVPAAVKLPAIFSDHMVLQQKTKVLFWGWADPGEKVAIQAGWSKKISTTQTDPSGKWKLSIPTPSAGGPFVIKVTGSNSLELKDVLIGEVWLCSGQSNMVFSLKSSEHAEAEIAAADIPSIRYFSVTRQYASHVFDDSPGAVWQLTSPKTAPSFSAVAYFFAKKIQQQLKVPVGIVYSAWGGTPAEAWTPAPVLKNDTVLSRYLDRWKEICEKVGKDSVAYHIALDQKDKMAKKPEEPKTLYYYERPWRQPGVLFNGMIHPVIPFAIKGVLWYQGESNVSYADEYYRLLHAMIDNWRQDWAGDGGSRNFPFYVVQIASFGYSSLDAAARLREGEYQVMQRMPNTGMAVTVDLGNMSNIHYTRKKEVGDRLARIALARDYGYKKIVYKGPECKRAFAENDKVVVEFKPAASGLVIGTPATGNRTTADTATLKGFELGYRPSPGDSLYCMAAHARLEGNKVIVWNDQVTAPIELRYAWLLAGDANLFNKEGLPAFPFRTKIESQK